MRAVILAAGVGRRIGDGHDHLPKALLTFGGKSLIERHIGMLHAAGIARIAIVVGYRADAIQDEIARLGLSGKIDFLVNDRYREGSIVSLWTARDFLHANEPAIVMDADVLYDGRLIEALVAANTDNCFLLDHDVEPGDEPQKLCIRDGRIVDLHKKPTEPHEWYGKSIGFLRCSPAMAAKLAERTDAFVRDGRTRVEHEEAIRDLILTEPPGSFGYVDVTGTPWVEIDFPEDIARAAAEILPRLRP